MAGEKFSISVLFKVIEQVTAPLKRIETRFKKLGLATEVTGRKFQKLGRQLNTAASSMRSTGTTLAATLTLPLILMGKTATDAAIEFESAFAGVRKTVDATEAEFAKLEKGILNIGKSIPIADNALFGIAETAGQLGIETENIVGFTKVMADLGATTNLSGEQAAKALARLANITQLPQDQFDRLGATIVALGNNLATTEAEIVEMGLRLAGAGKITGLTEAEILGLAGALSSVGVRAQAGGTAFTRVMLNIGKAVDNKASKKIAGFALIAGKSVKEFRKSFKTNAIETILEFIRGLDEFEKKGVSSTLILDALGFSNIRVSDALRRAAGSGDLFRKSIELGSKAFKENTALTIEANKRYATAKSRLFLFGKEVTRAAVAFGDVFVPILLDVVKFLTPFIQKLKDSSPATKNLIIVIGALAAVLGPLLIALSLLVGLAGTIALAFGTTLAIFIPFIPVMAVFAVAVLALGAAAFQIIKNWKQVGPIFKGLFTILKGLLIGALCVKLALIAQIFFAISIAILAAVAAFLKLKSLFAGGVIGKAVFKIVERFRQPGEEARIEELRRKQGLPPAGGLAPTVGALPAGQFPRQDVAVDNRSETDINLKVSAAPGTEVLVGDITNRKGAARLNLTTIGQLGPLLPEGT